MAQNLPPELLEGRPALAEDLEAQHPSLTPAPLPPPPKKYTKAVHERIVEELKKGQRAQGACARAGITVSTFHEWIRRGKQGDPHLYAFAEDVEIAYNLAEAQAVEVIHDSYNATCAADRKVYDAKWFLERARSDGYSKQVKTAVETQIRDFLIRLEAALDPNVFEQVLAVYLGQSPDAAAQLPAHGENEEERSSS